MKKLIYAAVFVGAVAVTALVTWLLVSISGRKAEEKISYFPLAEVAPLEPDPEPWGRNFPRQYDAFKKTMKTSEMEDYSVYGRYGGSESFSKLEKTPALKRLFAGYGFAVAYDEDRGHMSALDDMLKTERLKGKKAGPCMTCKTSQVPGLMETIGPEKFYATPVLDLVKTYDIKYTIGCADCHEAGTMALTVTRPAFREAMAARGVDLAEATRQEMRTYVCGQCHTEYYFKGEGNYLTFPWAGGFTIEEIERYYDDAEFRDWLHAETGAPLVKMQHPEFELWSTGVHARAGVSCADCHMPYKREGAMKISDHWVRTPLANVGPACTTCHRESESEMRERVLEIQDRTFELMNRAEAALIAAQDRILAARDTGVPDEELAEALALQRRAFIRYDFISAENSMGFHSPQESARILGDAVDYARQAELAAYRVMAPVPEMLPR
ncbi:MAG: ammonia-forming cytochrome c nitrite reductase subunit c552 [Candidatus Zixiibacteriota bacterium]|jgi:nitrite reductase (cytochrome c-552)